MGLWIETLTCVVVVGLASAVAAVDAPVLRAGAAVADITPPPGLPMWGYGGRRDLGAQGTRDRLWASAVVLEVGETKLALVGLDLGRAPARRTMDWIRIKVKDDAGVGHVMVVGSHTHHAPCIELEDLEPTASYVRELREKIADAIGRASRAAVPAKLAAATAQVERNRNRHSKLPEKPVDRTLTVLRLLSLDDRPIATVVNFAAHPTTLPATLFQYSADYPGPLRVRVEKEIGGHCVFLQGAAGDLSTDRRGQSLEEYGEALGDDVVRLARTLTPLAPAAPSLRVVEEELHFPSLRVDLKDPATYLRYTLAFFKALVDAFAQEYKDGVRPQLSVAVLNDEVGLVGASGEFFCGHSLKLRDRARLPHLLFLGYCNGYHQYFPTIEACAEGGYGADPEVSPVEIGAGERVMDRALIHLYRLRQRLK
jgi:hypothetical protein